MVTVTQNGSRPRSDLRLSDLARHVVLPSGIVSTAWPSVERQLNKMGTPLDEWQRGLCMAVTAKRSDGLYACGIGGAVFSVPRQSGKTYTVGALVFALCLANPGTLVLWSAHRTKTHNETFRSMGSMAERPQIAPFVSRVLTGAGTEAVEFTNGSRILFGAREGGFGRGFAKVDIIVLDEAQILTESAMEDMVPAANASPNGLVLMMGTPPRPKDPGEVFTNRREAALSGEDEDILYVEFSADDGAVPDDRKQWAVANPSFPHRTSETSILRMRKLLGSVESFLREGLGIWDKKQIGRKAFRPSDWDLRKGLAPHDGSRVFAVKFSLDGSHVALGAAVNPGGDSPIHVEGIRSEPMSSGIQWLVDFLVERKDEVAHIVVDGKSGAGYLVDALRGEKVSKSVIVTPTAEQVITAHSMVFQAVSSGGLSHSGQVELDDQAKDAVKRKIGANGGFGWQSSNDGSVSLLDAVTLAFWGAKTTKRKPGRRQRFR